MTVRQANKRLLRRDQTFRLPTGLTMTLPYASSFGNEVFITGGNVDHGAEALLTALAEKTSDALDIGANIGYYSLYLAPKVRAVYAFEPDPRSVRVLKMNTVENLHVFEVAITDRMGTVHLDVGAIPETSHLSGKPRMTTIDVPATTVDAFISEHAEIRVGVMKIDVEGHDLAVLQGSEQTIDTFSPLILTEFSDSEGGTNDNRALHDLCERHKYEIWGYAYRSGKPSPNMVLRELTGDGSWEAKMLFLVPPRLKAVFASRRGSRASRSGEV
jgi:FkbM family methyltransferase